MTNPETIDEVTTSCAKATSSIVLLTEVFSENNQGRRVTDEIIFWQLQQLLQNIKDIEARIKS